LLGNASEVSGEETGLLVGGVEGVDEGVDAGAIGARGHEGGGAGFGGVGSELGCVAVELEVAVGGVVGVDEGVEVGVDGSVVVVGVVDGDGGDGLLGLRSGGEAGSLLGSDLGFGGEVILNGEIGVEGGGVLAAGGNVGALENAEAVLSGGVLDGVGLAVVTDVRVLADAVAGAVGLFAEDLAVLGGEGGAGAAVAGVETLLFEDLGELILDLAGSGGQDGGGAHDVAEHYGV